MCPTKHSNRDLGVSAGSVGMEFKMDLNYMGVVTYKRGVKL